MAILSFNLLQSSYTNLLNTTTLKIKREINPRRILCPYNSYCGHRCIKLVVIMGRRSLLLVLLVLTISLLLASSNAQHSSYVEYVNPNDLELEESLSMLFGAWMKVHNKNYIKHDEISLKYSTFNENVQFIKAHNKTNPSLKLGFNKFTDLSTEKYCAEYLRLQQSQGGVIHVVLVGVLDSND